MDVLECSLGFEVAACVCVCMVAKKLAGMTRRWSAAVHFFMHRILKAQADCDVSETFSLKFFGGGQ